MALILANFFVAGGFAAAGLALASIPIIIHILNRRRFKVVPWAAMEYLLQAMRKNRKRLKFEQWLLLATRCLLLALLGFALARPLTSADSLLSGISQRSGLYTIVIDNSYSMDYQTPRNEAKTHLDQAKILAKQMVDKMTGGESVVLITAGSPAKAVIAKPSLNMQEVRDAIDHIDQSYGAADLPGALQKALDVAHEDSKQPRKFLEIFTDGAKSAWEGPQVGTALSNLGPELVKEYHIAHHSMGLPQQQNTAVAEVKDPGSLVTTHFSADFSTVVRDFGGSAAGVVSWRQDDVPLPGGDQVNIDLQGKAVTSPQIKFAQGGPHVLTVSLASSDPLPMDNTRYRVIDVASQLPVLVVQGDSGVAGGGSGEALVMALAPQSKVDNKTPGPNTSSSFAPDLISDSDLPNKVLGGYRAILLTNVLMVSGAQADALAKFVRDGGTLMLFMGPQVSGEKYNEVLGSRGLLPGRLIRPISDQNGFLFDFRPDGNIHAFLQLFRGQQHSGLDTSRVYEYWQLELAANSQAERVLNYLGASDSEATTAPATPAAGDTRDPAITFHRLGQGRVLWVSTSASNDWTPMRRKPVYVELMQELLLGSVRMGEDWMNLQVGDSLTVPSTLGLTSVPQLSDPFKKPIPVILRSPKSEGKDSPDYYASDPLTKPGIYSLTIGTRTVPIAVNIPAIASDVRTLSNENLKKAMGDIDVELLGDTLPADALTDQRGNDLGWSVMCIVFAMAGLECLMAMRFGHHRKSSHVVPKAPLEPAATSL